LAHKGKGKWCPVRSRKKREKRERSSLTSFRGRKFRKEVDPRASSHVQISNERKEKSIVSKNCGFRSKDGKGKKCSPVSSSLAKERIREKRFVHH